MQFTDEQIREILELKDRTTAQIEKHKEEIELLEKNLNILNSFLKQTSFTKASSLGSQTKKTATDAIPITKGVDGQIIANAYVTADQVSIIPTQDVILNADTPPFRTFFLDRIIGEMKKKDSSEVDGGRIKKESVIDYVINKNGSNIGEIIIKNYRQNERVKEIINTLSWSFTRMLENQNK